MAVAGTQDPVDKGCDVVSLPLWAVFAVSFGTPALTFVGVLVAQYLSRLGAHELESRSRREETMRNLRWAAELAVSDDAARAQLGIAQLAALTDSDMLDDAQQTFVDAAIASVLAQAVDDVSESGPVTEVAWTPNEAGHQDPGVGSAEKDRHKDEPHD